MCDLLHVVHAIDPAICVAMHGCHPRLKAVAAEAGGYQLLLTLALRKQHLPLQVRKIVPPDHALFQRPIHGGVLVRRQLYARFGFGLKTHSADSHRVIARGKLFHAILSVRSRQDVHGNFGLQILRLNECSSKRRPIRAFHRSSDGRSRMQTVPGMRGHLLLKSAC